MTTMTLVIFVTCVNVLLLSKILCVVALSSCDDIVVDLPLGKVQGFSDESLNGRTFLSFEGIPYAVPPVGKYRFEAPVPAKPWRPDTLIARTKYVCMQYYQYTPLSEDFVTGDEDCLYLNIYTPSLNKSSQYDVIVYIHGGAFMFNSGGTQQPHYLLDKDVVYVNFNYRLGPLGFLSTEDDVVPGNNGIKDQILALKWIKDNVVYFGGNPNSVTLTGMSAGGASVHLHYLMAKSKGLFHRGISQSGTALNAWVLPEKPLETSQKVADSLGCPTENSLKMVECLKELSGKAITRSVKHLQPWLYNPFSPFGVVVDTWSSDPLLKDHPYNLLKRGRVADLPWMVSFTSSEGLYPGADFYNDTHLQDLDFHWNKIIPYVLHYHQTVAPSELDRVSQEIRKCYLGNESVSKFSFMQLVKILSDRLFIYDIEKAARLQASVTESPVYAYQFTYRGAHSKSESRSGVKTDFGAAHGDDTGYVFKTNVDTTTTENDRLMIDLFVEMFTSFAKDGKPNIFEDWLPLSRNPKESFRYLKISSPKDLEMVSEESLGNRQFWENLPIQENEKLFSLKDEL